MINHAILPDRVAESVKRITAPNPGPKTLEGTNLYLVGPEPYLLIDAGPYDRPFLHALADALQGMVTDLLLTHSHPDHAGGAGYLARRLGIPTWVSPKFDSTVRDELSNVLVLSEGEKFAPGSSSLQAISMPGHSWDHVCFWLQPQRILFSGDNILGRGTTLIALPEGDMTAYMQTLAATKDLNASSIAPGHGPMIHNPDSTIDQYIRHRREREQEVLDALTRVDSVNAIVDSVYRLDDPEVRHLAALSVGAQLEKLEREGRVERVAPGRYRPRADS